MRYAIVSDIHANLQAWNAVLLDIRASGVQAIVALGDLVGYGPEPAEVLKSVYANVDHFVLGNHDAVICGKMPETLFNESARRIIAWTREQLGSNAVRFLRTLPLTLDGGTFRCAHGEFGQPAAFHYIIEPADALPSWQAVDNALLFVGHTHQPAIYLLGQSGTPHVVSAQDFTLEPHKRFLVNVGSVGQPRDGDARASYCLYDTDEGVVRWRRIPFDLDAYRAAMRKASLPEESSYFLRHDPRAGTPPLREILNFSPARTAEESVRGAVEVQEIKALKRRVTRWKVTAGLVLALLVLLAAAGGGAWWRHATRAAWIAGPAVPPIDARAAAIETELLPLPRAAVPAGAAPGGWEIRLGHKRRQNVAAHARDGAAVFTLASRAAGDEVALSSAPIRVAPGMKLLMLGRFRKSTDFRGTVALVLSLTRRDADGREEVLRHYRVKEPIPNRSGGLEARWTTDELPARAYSVRLHVQGQFTGSVEVSELALVRKK